MRFLFLLLLFLTLSYHAEAGYTTPNTGVRWNFDSLVARSGGSVTGTFPEYLVSDTVFIAPNDVLEVQKGSTIRIAYRKGITVRGGFLALGTFNERILFTKSDSTWQELRFEDSAVDSLCRMSYITVEYARLGLNFVSASPTLEYSTVRNTGLISGTLAGSGNYAIQCFNSNAVIIHDSIYNNAQYGININSGSSPVIEHCRIFNNNLQGTGFKNQISIGTQGINSPVIRKNYIYHTTPNIRVGGISISAFLTGSGSNAIIESNFIYKNAYGIAVASQGTTTLNVVIRKNVIYDNTFSDVNAAGSGINFNSLSPSVQKTIVAENMIHGNSWGVTILGNAQPNLGDLTNADTTDDGGNRIYNNGNRDTLFALYNNSPVRIMAQNNYWGTGNPDSVAMVIVDSSDAASLGRVLYTPFWTDPHIYSVQEDGIMPVMFTLGQNYPNPFNPATTIPFTLQRAAQVTVQVYDLLGRSIARLTDGEYEAGAHQLRWDAAGHASGVYLYRLTAGGKSVAGRMVLQR
ncbi:MAG: T9SS type A sorting domain-containing protein [Bacteroidetes bacterium]|nr:T9SS type A sorting domain-containing protein [Bacteroidota bacterium]